MHDFHTHTFLSDGVLSPIELIRRAIHAGYVTIAVTDHVGPGNLEQVLKTLITDCAVASKRWDILALPGVEITHTPIEDINNLAHEAKKMGAKIVNVHGETLVEPVVSGTNLAAARSEYVDILAHPGLITLEEAKIASSNGIFLELSARKGHSLANGHVAKIASDSGALTILDSDAHGPEDLLTVEHATNVALGAGIEPENVSTLLSNNPAVLLSNLGLD